MCIEVQQEIDRGRIPRSSLGGISISAVLNALESEPGGLKFYHTFKVLKGA